MPQYVFECPSNVVDLDHCSVITLACYEDKLDNVIESGCLYLGLGRVTHLYWGRTAPADDGFRNIVVDVPEITITVLRALWGSGLIDDDFPEAKEL